MSEVLPRVATCTDAFSSPSHSKVLIDAGRMAGSQSRQIVSICQLYFLYFPGALDNDERGVGTG